MQLYCWLCYQSVEGSQLGRTAQWNFNPRSSTIEVEDYKVDLRHVLALELTIDPDLGKNQAFAALDQSALGTNLSRLRIGS
jgi:hypothetical protein